MSEVDQLSLLVHWEGACHLIFDLCAKMPKRARFSFVSRLEGAALDLNAQLTLARYKRGAERHDLLTEADAQLAILRVLSRLAHGRQLISHGDFERLSAALDEAGRMLGGWIRAQAGSKAGSRS